jgi:hypothetical protein
MTTSDNPQDYVPPKHRAAQAETLRAVANEAQGAVDAINATADAVRAETPTEGKVTDYALLGAQAILKYAEASARHCEEVGDAVLEDGQHARDECYHLAEDIRHVARIQAAAVERAMTRNKIAAQGVNELRKRFHDDIAKEQSELEARKTRATG